jgi:hypothetical protein
MKRKRLLEIRRRRHLKEIDMPPRLKYITVSILVLIYFLLEYAWIPWAGVPKYYEVPFIYSDGPVRLDSWIYNACVKIEHLILPLIIYILTPFKRESKFMLLAFGLSFVEFFLTWNEPIAKIPMPFDWGIPISTAPLKLASICYFMVSCVIKLFEE